VDERPRPAEKLHCRFGFDVRPESQDSIDHVRDERDENQGLVDDRGFRVRVDLHPEPLEHDGRERKYGDPYSALFQEFTDVHTFLRLVIVAEIVLRLSDVKKSADSDKHIRALRSNTQTQNRPVPESIPESTGTLGIDVRFCDCRP
jgi:hypothetical protein